MKQWLLPMMVIVSFIIAPFVGAQSFTNVPGDDGLPAHVYVRDLTLEKQEYAAGEQVRGWFTLFNADDRIVSDAYYVIRLQGAYANNGVARVLYDVQSHGPVMVRSQAERRVEFAYTPPKGVAGSGLGIQIQAMLKSGLLMGSQDERLKINGESSFLDVGLQRLRIGDEVYGVETGPTVTRDQQINVEVSLHNPTAQPITVTPVVTVYNRSIVADPLESRRRDNVTVTPDQTISITIPLPTFDYTPRVYAGVVQFVDDAGATIGAPFTVRYIVQGDIANIERISTAQQQVLKGEPLTLVVDISASPINFGGSGKDPVFVRVGDATVQIQVFNEHDEIVAQSTQTINADDPTIRKVVSVPAERDARQIKIRSSVVKNNTPLSSYETDLEIVEPANQSEQANQSQQRPRGRGIARAAVVIVLASIAVAMIIKRHG